jgi:hypothetical protein
MRHPRPQAIAEGGRRNPGKPFGDHSAMFIIKLSLLTCAFYLVMAVAAEVATLVSARLFGGVIISRVALIIFFALAWAVGFALAWRVLTSRAT